jgi:hypothetical protein
MLMAVAAAAQPGVGLGLTLSPSEGQPPVKTHPSDAGCYVGRSLMNYEPVFSGPAVKSKTSEFRASFGLAFTWGGPPHHPSSRPVIR